MLGNKWLVTLNLFQGLIILGMLKQVQHDVSQKLETNQVSVC